MSNWNDVFRVAGSALSANNLWMGTTASNMANANSVATTREGVYHRRFLSLEVDKNAFDNAFDVAISGVKVGEVMSTDAGVNQEYNPHHPKADKDGFIYRTNVNLMHEMADMMAASRSYEKNIQLLNSTKNMIQETLRLID